MRPPRPAVLGPQTAYAGTAVGWGRRFGTDGFFIIFLYATTIVTVLRAAASRCYGYYMRL